MVKNRDKRINLKIQNANGVLYEEAAFAVSSTNNLGEFDILPGHSNFITKIEKHLTIHKEKGVSINHKIKNGLLKCKHDKVDVYLGIDSL